MDNGIFGLAMYGALKRDANYIETKKGKVTLADLIKFYEEHVEEHSERGTEKEKKSEKRPRGTRKRKDSTEGKD